MDLACICYWQYDDDEYNAAFSNCVSYEVKKVGV